MPLHNIYDIIVIGGGHAGLEASCAASRMGGKTLLITSNINTIGQLSCNPSMGGIAKGQIIREIDAIGGFSGIVTDNSSIQFRMLNKSKGPAMWSPRSQCDRKLFSLYWIKILKKYNNNLEIYQDTVNFLIIKKYKVVGVKTISGLIIKSKSVILTNGTFLNGKIYIGNNICFGGRFKEPEVKGITEQLKYFGIKYGRMKTGTSPRVDKTSINYKKMKIQYGDKNVKKFSFFNKQQKLNKQCVCYITYTNVQSLDIIKKNLKKSPLYDIVKGKGPRYCPSIEEKVVKFPHKIDHPIFVEPEGFNSKSMYINGFSISLDKSIQYESLKCINGFENVKILQPGYTVEYDYFLPNQLKFTLESKIIENLFFAGQINGTTGYEEAAAQGLSAGINSYLKINFKNPFILKRYESYIGVLIDDLVTKGTDEPYRMFTSRAEYRMLLRQDNADERLSNIGYKLGLISKNQIIQVENKKKKISNVLEIFKKYYLNPNIINKILVDRKSPIINQKKSIENILSRAEIQINDLIKIPIIYNIIKKNNINKDLMERIAIEIKYKGYLKKEKENAKKLSKLENIFIPHYIDYSSINSLSKEAVEKLSYYKPISLAQASRISGISPSDVNVLFVYIKK